MNLDYVFRGRRYWHHKWWTWYEKCPIIKELPGHILIKSQNYPKILSLYLGGKFLLPKFKLARKAKFYHSRYGDYFYLVPPEVGGLFPSEEIMNAPDITTIEAYQHGWTRNMTDWEPWQKDCYLYASTTKASLETAIALWRSGELNNTLHNSR